MSEITKLAHNLALEAAAAALESNTLTVESEGENWIDINTNINEVPLGSFLRDELRYLTLRKAIKWHPNIPNLMQIVKVGQ